MLQRKLQFFYWKYQADLHRVRSMWFNKLINKTPKQEQQELQTQEDSDVSPVGSQTTEQINSLAHNFPETELPVVIPPVVNGNSRDEQQILSARKILPTPLVQTPLTPATAKVTAPPANSATQFSQIQDNTTRKSFSETSEPLSSSAGRFGTPKNSEKALTVSAVREVAKDVFMENFPRLRQVAHVEAERRIELFLSELDVRLSRSLSNEQVNKFNDPAILHSLNQALQATALQNEASLRKILADLIVKRVLQDESSLKRIVYTEAIKTVPLLTSEMLDMLALTFLLRRAHILDINSWNDFRSRVWYFLEQFLSFRGTQAELQHLEYAGCGIVAPSSPDESDVVRIFRASYSSLFQRGLSFDEAKALRIPESAITDALYADETDVCYRFKFRNKTEMEAFFRRHPILSPGTKQRIVATFEKSLGSVESSYEKLISEVPSAAALVDTWNNSPIRFLDPTSVGLVIGATHFEGRTGQQVPIDIWIN